MCTISLKTLVNRAYVGQATLKDNEVVKKFRAYDGIHLLCMDKKLVYIYISAPNSRSIFEPTENGLIANKEHWFIVGLANGPCNGPTVSVTITSLGQPFANRCSDRMPICAPIRGPI